MVFPRAVGWVNGDGADVGRNRPASALASACRVVEIRAADPGGTVEAFKMWNKG